MSDEDYLSPGFNDEAPVDEQPIDENEENEDESEVQGEPEAGVAVRSAVINYVTGDRRKSRPIMSKYEYARLISTYAARLDAGEDLDPRVITRATDSLDRAEAALQHREASVEFPIVVHRPMPDGTVEVWRVSELALPTEVERMGITVVNS